MKTKQPIFHFYKGLVIWRNTEPHKLKYTARKESGGQFAADTLAGIKQLIDGVKPC